MDDEKEETWIHGVGFLVIATISVGAIMVIEIIWKAQDTVLGAFRKLRNKMTEKKEETKVEEKKEVGQEAVVLPSFDPQSLLSKNKEDAVKIAEENFFKTRVLKEDGKAFMGTMDYNVNRLNFEIEKGLVVKVSKG